MIRRATELFTLKLDTSPKAAALETEEMKVRVRVCTAHGDTWDMAVHQRA